MFTQPHINLNHVLIDSGSETNAVHPPYAAKLGLSVRTSDVKPNRSMDHRARPLGTVTAGFSLQDKLRQVILGMLVLTLGSAGLGFAERKLVWRRFQMQRPCPRPGG